MELIVGISITLLALLLIFLFRWKWGLIAFAILLAFNFFNFIDISYLPSISVIAGPRINLEDIVFLLIFILGAGYLFVSKKAPFFIFECLIILTIILISTILGISDGFIDSKIAIGGFREMYGWLFYIGLSGILIVTRDWRPLLKIISLFVILSIIIQLFELIYQHRIALPTSTVGFYSSTTYLSIGDIPVPYLWNRMPALLFLVYFMCLGRWVAVGEKKYLLFSIILLTFIILTLVRAWAIYILFGSVALFVFKILTGRKYKELIAFSIFVFFSLAVLLIISSNWQALISDISTTSPTLNRFVDLTNYQEDASYLIRLEANKVFYDAFMNSVFWGHGLGYTRVIEMNYGVWSTDVGIIASMSEFGIFVVIPVLLAFAKAYRLMIINITKRFIL